jgi:hypothetical protein
MGWIWNVLLSCSNEEFCEEGEDEPREICEPLERINGWIPHGKLVSLIKPTYAAGAGYGMDANLFGGGYKHFDIEAFIKVVEAQNWKDRANLQLWIKGAEEGMGEDPFELVKLQSRRSSRPKATAKPPGRSKKRHRGN